MNEIFTYKQAAPYIRKTRRMLKSISAVEAYINETELDIAEMKKLEHEQGKKNAILAFIKKTNGNYEKEFSDYLKKLEIALVRSKKLYNRVYSALDVIQNETVRAVIEYYYIQNNNLDDTCLKFSYSHSSICRYKKMGLSKIAEQLFGIIIEERAVGEKYYPEDEFAV